MLEQPTTGVFALSGDERTDVVGELERGLGQAPRARRLAPPSEQQRDHPSHGGLPVLVVLVGDPQQERDHLLAERISQVVRGLHGALRLQLVEQPGGDLVDLRLPALHRRGGERARREVAKPAVFGAVVHGRPSVEVVLQHLRVDDADVLFGERAPAPPPPVLVDREGVGVARHQPHRGVRPSTGATARTLCRNGAPSHRRVASVRNANPSAARSSRVSVVLMPPTLRLVWTRVI